MTKVTTERSGKGREPQLWGRDETGYRIQPTEEEIVEGLRLRGGELWLKEYQLMARLPKKNLKQWKELLKRYRAGVFQYLLEREPKIGILVACQCDARPYPHLTHDPPRGDEQPPVFIKGDLKQLREALVLCQVQGHDWTMDDLIKRMEAIDAVFFK
jgi:hypothetical protein